MRYLPGTGQSVPSVSSYFSADMLLTLDLVFPSFSKVVYNCLQAVADVVPWKIMKQNQPVKHPKHVPAHSSVVTILQCVKNLYNQ